MDQRTEAHSSGNGSPIGRPSVISRWIWFAFGLVVSCLPFAFLGSKGGRITTDPIVNLILVGTALAAPLFLPVFAAIATRHDRWMAWGMAFFGTVAGLVLGFLWWSSA